MKILIVTIQNSGNYGAMLQAYALREYLKASGHEVEIANYDNHFMGKGLNIVRHGTDICEWYYMIIDIVNHKKRKIYVKRFKEFKKDYLELNMPRNKYSLLHEGCPGFDVYISGSDQIWNPYVTDETVDEVYYCGMSRPGDKVISYGSSLGGYDFSNDVFNSQIRERLEKYSYISTREHSYIPKLEKLIGKVVTQVLDPVFLLDKEEWYSRLCVDVERKPESPYVLVYAMSKHENIIKRVKNDLGGKYHIVMIYEPLVKKFGIEYVVDAGPKEFVDLFYHANMVVTNSFHGMAFSFIFQKNFRVLDNARNMNRIYDFLEKIDAMEVLVPDTAAIDDNKLIDYSKTTHKIKMLVDESKEYLKKSIS